MRLTPAEQREIFELAENNNKAISLDWKFSVDDIVFNVKSILPELNINSLPEKQIGGDWTQSMSLEENTYDFKTDSVSLITDVISTINKHLQKNNQVFVLFNTQDDDVNYILINLSELPEYLEKGFLEV